MRRSLVAVATVSVVATPLFYGVAHAQSSWSPTLLVNTEAFQTIDDGDGSSNIELRFGTSTQTIKFLTTGRFQFSHGISVLGTISGSRLNVDRNATIGGTLAVSGTTLILGNTTVKAIISGATLRIGGGGADVQGALNVSGAVITDSNLTLNSDQTAADTVLTFGSDGTNETLTFDNADDRLEWSDDFLATGTISADGNFTINADQTAADTVLTFGSDGTNETLTFLNTADKFSFSDDIQVLGNISGSSLTVDGSATVSGTLLVKGALATKAALSGSTFYGAGLGTCTDTGKGLQYDIATGKFTCATISSTVGNGSGGILSLHPEYPNAIYFSSGSAFVGQLTLSGGTSALDNSYVWTSSNGTIQNYWISVRVRLPDNFSSWDPIKPIELRYKTGDGSAAVNHVSVRIKDTAGTELALTGGGGLANTAWTTALITGPEAGGTWAAKGYITVYVKLATTSSGNAAASYLNLNFETTTP